MARTARTWIGIGLACVLAVAVVALLPLKDWSLELELALEDRGFVMALVIYCAVSTVATLLLVPAWIFPLIAGAVFGPLWGLVAALVSALASALLAFLAARYVLRAPVERAARRSRTFKALDRAVAREAWKIVALVRMSPVLPSGMKSYFFGLTRVRLVEYAAASLLGMLPGVALKVYVGSAGRWAVVHGGAVNWAVFGAAIGAMIALAFLLARIARKAIDL